MTTNRKENYKDFKLYCDEYKVPTVINFQIEQSIIEIHKYVYNFRYLVKSLDYKNSYLDESVSDAMTALLLCRMGMFKAGMVTLRGSLENFMRFLGDAYSSIQHVILSTNVMGLFEENKSYFSEYGDITEQIDKAYSLYCDLCSYSHSALIDHQSNYDALIDMNEITSSDIRKGAAYFKRMQTSLSYILYATFYKVDNKFKINVFHTHRTFFLDNMPDQLREELEYC